MKSFFASILATCLINLSSFAQKANPAINTTFANCQNIGVEESETKKVLAKDQRLLIMENLVTDIRKLDDEIYINDGVSPYPKTFLQTCLNKKFAILDTHQRLADDSTRDSAPFLKVVGTIYLINAYRTSGKAQVQNFEEAYKFFGLAIKKDPSDWSSKIDRFQIFIKLFTHKVELKEFKSYTESQLDEYYKTIQKLLDDVVSDKKVPADVKATLYTQRAMFTKKVLLKYNESLSDWKKVLEFDPKNLSALGELGLYYHSLKRYLEAVPYFEKACAVNRESVDLAEYYFDSLMLAKDFQKLQLTSKDILGRFPKSALIRRSLARAQLELGDISNAQKNNRLALKLNPKDPVARTTQSIILEKQADSFVEKDLLSNAIQTYESAYQFDKDRPILRKKMSQIIYRYRKTANFLPKETALVEMKQIVELLYGIRELPELRQDGLEILIEAAAFTQQSLKTVGACNAYENSFSIITSTGLLKICGEAHLKQGSSDKASELLKRALAAEKDSATKREIKTLLNQIR